ncbi:MAG: hypothetical protein IPO58_15585 [Betaproteobacteria bacterium]|nr:hypothetical protein [Betaproteobacteria bacterium]
MAALRPDGTLDPTFADGGVFRFQLNPDKQTFCQKAIVLADDSIVVIGAESGSPGQSFLLRLTAAGSLDTTFGAQGVANVPLVAGLFWRGLAAGVDASMFVSGGDNVFGYVVKLAPGGAIDHFRSAPEASSRRPLTRGTRPRRLFFLMGSAGSRLSRQQAHGDEARGQRCPTPLSAWTALPRWRTASAIRPSAPPCRADGRIVVALRLKLAHGVWRLAAMRLNPDGSADLTYGVNGLSVIASDVTEVTYGMALAPDGKLWLFGRADLTAADSGLALARLLGTEITSSVVELSNTGLDHYFVTADPNEAAAIDAGAAGPGWARTGQAWKSGGPNRVCRFYGSPDIVAATGLRRGPNSHFYTIEAAECAVVKDDMGWQFESHDFNGWPVPAGGCPRKPLRSGGSTTTGSSRTTRTTAT